MVLSPFDEQQEAQAGARGPSVLAQIREAERQAEIERQRRIAQEAARFRELERQQAAEAARRAAAARQAELDRQAEVARQLAAFRAAQRAQEQERERQAEAARRAEAERQATIAAEMERFREAQRQQELEQQRRQDLEQRRQAEAARAAEAARQAQLQVERDRLRAIERGRELERQRVEARAEEQRALERARQQELDRQREQQRLRAKERELQLEREQEQIRQRERLEIEAPSRPPVVDAPSARLMQDTPAREAGAAATRDAFRAERELRERNAALRRAFEVVPGGPENLATIEALVDASERVAGGGVKGGMNGGLSDAEERLFAAGLAQDEAAAVAGPASVLPELASVLPELTGRTPGEAEALIRERAGEIERGLEAHDSFLDERRRRSANDPVRRRLLGTPGGAGLISTLELAGEAADGALGNGRTAGALSNGRATLGRPRFGGAEDDDALRAERTLTERNDAKRRAFKVLEDGDRTLAAVELLAANGAGRPRNPRALSAEEEERLFDAQLAIEESAAIAGAPSVLGEVQAMLAEEDAAEQEALIQEIASKIPGGTESVADFRREQRAKAENDARRREIAALPNGRALLDAEDDFDPRMGARGPLVEDEIDPSGGDFRINFREGRGARTFELTPDEEALFATPSSDGFIPERLIEIYKRGRFNEAEISFVEGFSGDARLRAELIAFFEESEKPSDWRTAEAFRDGASLPEDRASVPFVGGIGDAGRRFFGGARDVIESELNELGERQINEANFHVGNAERAIEFTLDELTRVAEDAGDAGQRFLNELDEIKKLDNVEAFDRLNQALLGGFTPQLELSPEGVARAIVDPRSLVFDWGRALEGLAGNETYSGRDHLLIQRLPDRYRDPLGDLLEDALLATAIGGTLAGIAISSPISAPVTAGLVAGIVVSHMVGVALADISQEDSDILELLEATWNDAQRLIDSSGLTALELQDVEARVLESLR